MNQVFALLIVTIWANNYAAMQRNDPYEIFSPNVYTETSSEWLKINKILFITSWNPLGHRHALKYAHKFHTLVICWYDLKLTATNFQLNYQEPFDQSFIPLIKKANPQLKVLLRIYLTHSAKQLFNYLGNQKINQKIAQTIVQTSRKAKANGIYYDSPFDTPTLTISTQTNKKYESLATTYSINLANLIKQNMGPDQTMLYALKNPGYSSQNIDFEMISKIKTDGFVVAALENTHYEKLAFYAIELISNLRRVINSPSCYMLLPFFSRRNGIGMPTPQLKLQLQKYHTPNL